MTRLDALRTLIPRLERTLAGMGGDDVSRDEAGRYRPLDGCVSRDHGGNPNHADDGKFAASPGGGHGKHWARRQRRKRKLNKLRRQYHAEIAAQKHAHRSQRSAMVKSQRGEREAMEHHYRKESHRAKKTHARELERHDKAAHKEASSMERRRERERAQESTQHAKGKITTEHMSKFEAAHLKDVTSIKEINDRARKGLEEGHRGEIEGIRHERKEASAKMDAEHRADRKGLLKQQREERREKIEGMKGELADHGFRRKGAGRARGNGEGTRGFRLAGSPDDGGPYQIDHGDAGGEIRRFGAARTTKASSAESILQRCLRGLGLWAVFRRGELTDGQRLDVLAEVRDYGKAWYHHEASELFRAHGRVDDGNSRKDRNYNSPTDAVGNLGHSGMGHESGSRAEAGRLGTSLVAESIDRALGGAARSHVGRFFRRARQFAHELILAGAMVLSGPAPLTDAELADVDRAAQEQAEYLQRFEREVIENPPAELQPPQQFAPIIVSPSPMTMSQFAARAELYGAAGWSAPLDVQRKHFIRHGQAVEERRVHVGSDVPCQMCQDEVAKGWVPIGTLLPIGRCTCLNQCHCHFSYRDANGKITWSGYGKRKLRLKRLPKAPAPVPPKPHVQVAPVEPVEHPPETIVGPWFDSSGRPIVYHYEEAE